MTALMDIDAIPGNDIVPDSDPSCARCHAEDRLIEDDGVVVCRPCVSFLGHVARDPMLAQQKMRDYLEEMHGDVVSLARVVTSPDEVELEWRWSGLWPGVTP